MWPKPILLPRKKRGFGILSKTLSSQSQKWRPGTCPKAIQFLNGHDTPKAQDRNRRGKIVEDRPEKILGPKVEAIDQNHLMTIWLPEILKTVKFLRVMNRSEEVVVETFAAVEVTRLAINQSVMKSLRKEILRTNLKIPKLVQPHDTPNANRAHLENHAIPKQTSPKQTGPKGIGPAEKELKEK